MIIKKRVQGKISHDIEGLVLLALTFCTWIFHDSLLSNSMPR